MVTCNSQGDRLFLVVLPFLALPLSLSLLCAVGCGPEPSPQAGSKTDKTPVVKVNYSADTQPVANTAVSNTAVASKPVLAGLDISSSEGQSARVPTEPNDLERVRKNDGTSGQAQTTNEPEKKYTDQEINKNLTTLVLAFQPDVRARHLLKFAREYLTPEQEDQALRLLLSHDSHFQRLIQKRSEVLSQAMDGDDTHEKLRQIKVETIDLSRRLRSMVCNKILNAEQNQLRKQRRMAEQLEEKTRKESRFAKKLEAETQEKR